MADEVDLLSDIREREDAYLWQKAQQKAAAIPKGEPGDCIECGRQNLPRVINDHCGRCRDELKRLGVEV